MAKKTLTYLKSTNRDFNNVLDSFLPYKRETLLKWNYIDCASPMMAYQQVTANNVTADGARASILWPGAEGETYWSEQCRIGAVTTDLETPIIEGTVPAVDTASTSAGLNIQMDNDTAADL